MVKRRKNSAVRQEEIIDAARKLVVKHGSEHVTVGRIAREVGISEGAIYRHFKSKRDVLSGLADRIADDLLADIKEAQADNNSSLDIIDAALSRHLSTIQQRKGISFLVIAEIISFGDKKLNKQVYTTINEYIDGLSKLLQAGIKSGQIKPVTDTEAMALLFFGMIQGLVNIWALGHYSFDIEEKYSKLWDVLRDSIIRR